MPSRSGGKGGHAEGTSGRRGSQSVVEVMTLCVDGHGGEPPYDVCHVSLFFYLRTIQDIWSVLRTVTC